MGGIRGNAGQHICKPSLRIDVVHLGGDDEAVHGGSTIAAAIGSAEQPPFSAQSDHPFILPISGKSWKSIIRGIRFFDIRSLFGG
jgi:hypothetical protein